MMITTTLASTQYSQSSKQASVFSLRLAYIEAEVDYQTLEQQIRNTSVDQFNLLVQLNQELAAASEKMEAAFDAWSLELDCFLDMPIELETLPTLGLRLIDEWLHDSHGGRTLAVG
jgi:hypothetical protein